MGATSSSLWSKTATIVGHSILAAILWNCARSVDLTSKAAITSFYMFIWKVTPIFISNPNQLFYHFCNPSRVNRVDELLKFTPHVAPQLFYAEYLLIPLVR
ncbi:hypothetical protein PR202_ga14748 [Eleusine coracana subsp. coracana]|uniref:Uncharacterized protein n=1 Tax=Eleusine coracana subsp. coracana TaxID=191504 RepID=A0AAV5CI94_ELECO|nr:hypothetical protein PR202_ga14748 [Eleusine coracana subsp. coracana]